MRFSLVSTRDFIFRPIGGSSEPVLIPMHTREVSHPDTEVSRSWHTAMHNGIGIQTMPVPRIDTAMTSGRFPTVTGSIMDVPGAALVRHAVYAPWDAFRCGAKASLIHTTRIPPRPITDPLRVNTGGPNATASGASSR